MTAFARAFALALVAAFAACGESESTRVDVVVAVGGNLIVDEFRAELGPHSASAAANEQLQLFIDDALAGQPSSLQVWGLASGVEVGYGATTVTPIAHDGTIATVTVTALACDTSCEEDAVVCSDDGTTRCELQPDGCLDWSPVEPCPAAEPYCSDGTCSATCADECTATEPVCAGGFATRTCGQFDGDSCLDWSVPVACDAGATCTDGSCGTSGCDCAAPRPASVCVGNALRVYDGPPTCGTGTCSYGYTDRACAGGCLDDRCFGEWLYPTQTTKPAARFAHTAVWTGTELIIWGGASSSTQSFGDGARYNPTTGAWTAISSMNAPAARRAHSAVWTGTEMIVWGGSSISQGTPYADGGRYNPATNTWTTIPATTTPGGRFGHTAVWTGAEMIVWGGAVSSVDSAANGARYNPSTGTWTLIPATGAPAPRRDHSAVWTGTEMIVWGGSEIWVGPGYANASAFDPASNTWTPTVTTGTTPGGRSSHAAVWTGDQMIIWGGAYSSTQTYADGAQLSPALGTWLFLPVQGRPTARRQLPAVWTGTSMLSWGGSDIAEGYPSSQMVELRLYVP